MNDQASGHERENSARNDGLAAVAILLVTIALIVFVVSSLL